MSSLKHSWFELQHQSSPDVNWKSIEAARAYQRHLDKMKNSSTNSRNSLVTIGDDQIVGEWIEKGSNNLAGSMVNCLYDADTEFIYAIAAGGSLWRGTESGQWELLNDDLRFDGSLFELARKEDGSKRLLLTIGGIPYYTDMGGLEVYRASGYTPGMTNQIIKTTSLNEGRNVFILTQRSPNDAIDLFYSNNYGISYSKLKDFEGTNPNDFSMGNAGGDEFLYIIEAFEDEKSRLYKWDKNLEKFALVLAKMNIAFGANGKANLAVAKPNNQARLFLYDVYGNFYKSTNEGSSWQYIEKLPAAPWSVGITISKTNPDVMLLGEIDCHRSIDGGKTWERVNYWWEYYIDEVGKLHADIMDIKEFRRSNGSYFTLICNHGGISITENYALTNTNISLSDLNVSQYYDVKTSQIDQTLFCASQDQGFQVSQDLSSGPLDFNQVRAGDYAHLTFTGINKDHLWMVYPLGETNYYVDPKSGDAPLRFNGLSKIHRSIWMPPISKKPNNKDEVYLAGGNLDGGSGSHIIRLYLNTTRDEILAEQIPFDFSIGGGEISYIAFNQFNSNIWYVSTTNGEFYISNNNGIDFNLSAYDIPQSEYLYASKILPSKFDPNLLFVCGSGYSNPAVIYSDDGGLNFYPLSTKLPKTAAFDMAFNHDESFLFLASEAGPLVYIFENNSWYPMRGDIAPNVSYWSVEYSEALKKLRFGTYGRGVWDFDLLYTSANNEQIVSNEIVSIFPNPVIDELNINSKLFSMGKISIRILNYKGEEILKTTLKENEKIVDCSQLKPGIYYLVFDLSNNIFSKSFIKI